MIRVCRLCDVCLSVAYIGPKSRTERPRKTKIGTEVATSHVTRTPLSRSKGQSHQAALVGCSSHYIIYKDDTIIITRASRCLSIKNIHGARHAGCRRRKACMGWRWAAACGVQGRGIMRCFPHSLLELRVMEVVVTTGAIRRAKLQSNRHH